MIAPILRVSVAVLALLVTLPAAAGNPKPLLDALSVELARAKVGLALPDAPQLYHLRYQLQLQQEVSAHASYGALLEHRERDDRSLGVEVRVGAPTFDNTGFGGWETGFSRTSLPQQLTPYSLRLAAWRLTDSAYKDAVEQFARKAAAWSPPADHPGDYLLRGATVADLGAEPDADAEALFELTRELSASFPAERPMERAEVYLSNASGSFWTLDTEETSVIRPYGETSVVALAHVRSPDGALLTDQRTWLVRRPDQLPAVEAMRGEIEAMASELSALPDAAVLEGEYVGPVLFEDDAAIDLFRYLLVPQLEGTPPVIPFDTVLGKVGSGMSGSAADGQQARVGRRALPAGWSAVDDPESDPDHVASFQFDAEGTPARPVELIEDGIVRSLLMSRIPSKGLRASNGHARGWPGRRLCGRTSKLTLTPHKRLSSKKMIKLALQLSRSYGNDHVLVVRRLEEPPVRAVGASFFSSRRKSGAGPQLPPPVCVVRVYSDGREEIVRGAAFAGVHRWVLRDIAAAGAQVEKTWFAPSDPGGSRSTPSNGIPTFVSAPEVLVGEMELVPLSGDPNDRPVIPPPDP